MARRAENQMSQDPYWDAVQDQMTNIQTIYRLVVRSVRHAEAAEAALRTRVAKAKAQVEALNLHGRGRKRFEEVETLRQAVTEMVQRHRVEDFLWLRYDPHTTRRQVRA